MGARRGDFCLVDFVAERVKGGGVDGVGLTVDLDEGGFGAIGDAFDGVVEVLSATAQWGDASFGGPVFFFLAGGDFVVAFRCLGDATRAPCYQLAGEKPERSQVLRRMLEYRQMSVELPPRRFPLLEGPFTGDRCAVARKNWSRNLRPPSCSHFCPNPFNPSHSFS